MATCKYCNAGIEWKKSRKGNYYPVDRDGQFHSKTCKQFNNSNDDPLYERNEDAACCSPCGEEPMGCSTCDRMGDMSNDGYYNY